MRQMAEMHHGGLNHSDLRPSRTKIDEGDVKSLTEMLKDVWQNPFSLEPQNLSSISTLTSLIDAPSHLLFLRTFFTQDLFLFLTPPFMKPRKMFLPGNL